jgi:hypothetical protein
MSIRKPGAGSRQSVRLHIFDKQKGDCNEKECCFSDDSWAYHDGMRPTL